MIKYLILICCLILAIACEEYEPQGSNEVFVEKKEYFYLPELEINCFDDTINLFNSTTIKYNIINHGNPIEEVQIKSESHNYNETFNYGYSEFTLNSEYLSAGNYKLNVRIIFDSNTGSLANKLGAEMYYVDYEVAMNYVTQFKGSSRRRSARITAVSENNQVKISWYKYNMNDFNYYILYKGDPDGNFGDSPVEWSKIITDYNSIVYYAPFPSDEWSTLFSLRIYKKDGSYISDHVFYSEAK